jgi:hypothetical protein
VKNEKLPKYERQLREIREKILTRKTVDATKQK